ncbi:hypothetical protein C5167_012025 [Papaver somniferum]|uniref:Uncharacterized protein n=1 Tax=Papaver somniferum TaxID=3469 RepID=A0A4Y7J087_PAPSO|nr:hypothetical protein C5167_012025 [Papaver somniferum]
MGSIFSSPTIPVWDGGHDTIGKHDQNQFNRDLSFYFVKYRIYQNHELETMISHAGKEIRNMDQTCNLIRETILQRKLIKDDYRRWLDWLSWEDDRYKKVINEKKTKIDYRSQARIGEIRAKFDTVGKKGDDTCTSEKELNNRVCSLHFRTRCAKSTFVKEKQLLQGIKQLEETRPGIVANDALKQKRFNESMEWVGRPIRPEHCSCRSSRRRKNLKDMDLDKLKREKQVFSARAKNAEETWKATENEILSLELKLAGIIEKRTVKEKLLVKLKEQLSEEKLNYNQQHYNKYESFLRDARTLDAEKNTSALEELSHTEV